MFHSLNVYKFAMYTILCCFNYIIVSYINVVMFYYKILCSGILYIFCSAYSDKSMTIYMYI